MLLVPISKQKLLPLSIGQKGGTFYSGARYVLILYHLTIFGNWVLLIESPTCETGGTLGFLAVCLSVCLSVSLSVSPLGIPNFSQSSFEILTWNLVYTTLSWHDTDQFRLLSWLTFFYLSCCPFQKFGFLDFPLLSFVILTLNLVNEFVLT